jgi:hypothetical protein
MPWKVINLKIFILQTRILRHANLVFWPAKKKLRHAKLFFRHAIFFLGMQNFFEA